MNNYTQAQKQAIDSIEQNTAVVAGAGSGKTSVLVDRFIKIVASGVDCRKVLAITFTNKAASEMMERIRDKMTKLANDKDDLGREFWLKQKKALTMAYIGTIHGLCANIIRTNPLEAKVEPDFHITNEAQAIIAINDSVKSTLYKAIKKEDDSVIFLLQEYGYFRLFDCLKDLVNQFNIDEVQQEDFLEQLAKGSLKAVAFIPALRSAFLDKVDELLAGVVDLRAGGHRSKLEEIQENLSEIKEALMCLPKELDSLEVLSKYFDGLAARSKDKALVVEVKELKEQLVSACYDYKAIEVIEHWASVIKLCVLDFAKFKRRKGILTFDDLEYVTYRLLKDNEQICKRYSSSFTHIMIDEFQDTNGLQKNIAYLLAGSDDKVLKNQKLFIVGDDKQSIYRFRGADVGVFAKVRNDIKNLAGEEIQLLDNFRSVEGILSVCNDLFVDLMQTRQAKGVVFEALKPNKQDIVEPVGITLLEKEENPHLQEAKTIAKQLKQLVVENGYSYADMAILLRTKTHLESYIEALEEVAIPYNVLDGQGFFSVPEILDMLNLLRFLENESKDIALLGVLRSPLFALDDQTITVIALQDSSKTLWQNLFTQLPDYISNEQKDFVVRAQSMLGELLYFAKVVSLGPLLRIIIEKLKIMPLLLSYSDGAQKYANMEKLVDIVFAFEQETGGGLLDFLRHVDNLLHVEARESMEQIENEQSDAVKILTIHKSKGLQFKVVVIPNLDASFYNDKDTIFYVKERGLGIKLLDNDGNFKPTSLFRQLKEEDNAYNIEEMKRLLYVAMTRAEEKLILSASGEQKNSENWLNWFLKSFNEEEDYFVGNSSKIRKINYQEVVLSEDVFVKTGNKLMTDRLFAQLQEQIAPLVEKKEGSQFVLSATALQEYKNCPRRFFYKYIVDMPEFAFHFIGDEAGDGVAANVVGLIVHSFFEYINTLDYSLALDLAIKKHVGYADNKLLKNNISSWLESYLASDLYKDIASYTWLSEQNFMLPLLTIDDEEVWFSGSIDCLIVDKEEMFIVDFKTDKNITKKASVYEHQLMLYTLAAEMLYPDKTVNKASLHFIRLNDSLVVDVKQERKRLLDEIKLICSELKNKEQEIDFSTNSAWCKYCSYNYFCPETTKNKS